MVSILSVLYGSTEILRSSLTAVDAYTLLTFCLLYTPCIAAVAAVKREEGMKGAVMLVIFQCAVAWLIALAMRGILLII